MVSGPGCRADLCHTTGEVIGTASESTLWWEIERRLRRIYVM